MTAAGGPPSRTIARTRARKLPDTLSFDGGVSAAVRSLMTAQARRASGRTRGRKLPDTLSFDVVVSAAVRSLMTAQARSARARGMFQSADPDASAARTAAALSAASWTHCLEGLGCRITWVLR